MNDWLGYTLEDFGNRYQIKGVVYGDAENTIIISLPEEPLTTGASSSLCPTFEEWKTLLAQTDNPKLVITDETRRIVKAIIQKNSRMVQEWFRWSIFRRDKFICQYCGAQDRPLTIDEYVCQALGGPIHEDNCKTACRPCNKAKGHMTVQEWEEYRKQRGMKGPND